MTNEMTPEVKSKLLAARAFAQERKPDIARAILEATDHPKAREMLAKLPPKKTSAPLMRLLTVLGVLILVTGTAFMIGYASAPKQTVNVLFDYQPTETNTPHPDATQNPDHATMTVIAIENEGRILNLTETAVMREVFETETAVMRETQNANATLTAIVPESP